MFNIAYEKGGRTFHYLDQNVGIALAFKYLEAFKERYLNEDGTGKQFPNGKGFYDFANPRIVSV